jgi:hypothetical protein
MNNNSEIDIESFEIGTYKEWKFGLITRDLYRVSENQFEIHDTSNNWIECVIDKKTLQELLSGERTVYEINWE